jgi:hypothetical protein
MTSHLNSARWLAIGIALAMVVALVACSGDSEPEPPETPEPAAAAAADEPEAEAAPAESGPAATETDDEPAAAEESESEPEAAAAETDDEPADAAADESPAAQAEASSGELDLSIDGGTTWQDVFDALTGAEQSCVRDALGDDLPASALSERILVEGDTEPWQADLLSCLSEPAVESLFFGITVAAAEEGGVTLNAEERSCLREVVAGLDVTELITATAASPDDVAASAEFAQGMIACLPELMLRGLLEGSGTSYDDLTEEERDCLRDLLSSPVWVTLLSGEPPEDPEAIGALFEDLFACVPGALLLGEDFGAGVAPADNGAASADDDHTDTLEAATPAAVGGSVGGDLQHQADIDVFVFEAEEGVLYRVDVVLDTLDDSVLTLYDAGGVELAFNDDHGDSTASRIEWQTPASGDYYLAVQGWGGATGAYRLTITELPNSDDHGDQLPPGADATSAAVGGSVEGALQHQTDIDVFVFEAEAGVLYRIDVVLDTLADSMLTLYDAGGSELAFNDDHGEGLASRIEWQAPASGAYYLAVQGWGDETGSYSLTIAQVGG